MEDKYIVAYTDGSSRGNPGPGGWGAVVWYPDDTIMELGGREDTTTNNRMELTAAFRALQVAGDIKAPMRVYTDSKYVKEGITNWITGWEKGGWKTKNKEDVLNKDLWIALRDALEVREKKGAVEWILLLGHSGTPGNERADKIATDYADKRQGMLYSGSFGSYMVDVTEPDPEVIKEKAKKRSETRARSNAKAYSYLSLIDGKAMRHDTWVECEARVKGKNAKFKKALSADDEKQILSEWGVSLS